MVFYSKLSREASTIVRSRDSADPAWGMDPAEYDPAARSPERNIFKLWG
jgi:hypothetical protein